MKKIYLCGPISALPEKQARANFEAAERIASSMNFEPVNPMKLPHQHDKEWSSYLREDIKALMECDVIGVIDLPYISRGADLEKNIAVILGIPQIFLQLPGECACDITHTTNGSCPTCHYYYSDKYYT